MTCLRISLVLGLAAALPAQAILERADRDDGEYLEMAAKYTSSVAIEVPGGGEGVLVQPRWILTSAQVASALQAMKGMPPVTLDGRKYAIKDVRVYPTWRAGTPSSDLGLVYLDRAVKGVAPTTLYRADDEGGKGVVIVGHGETGKIGAAARAGDGKKRAAINTIDRVAPKMLTLMVKKPDEASDLQGALGAGDGGGPAYIQEKDELFVAGIASGAEGDAQLYARVSAFAAWMDAIFLRAAKDELRDELDVPGT
ncbi:MAG TPA: trypsin-like serine protease [Usitatibacter sp.]|nr:trypsin-like serine protease [Usitatibacter sp.]